MATLLYTPEAAEDLRQIVEYIAANNLSASIRWLDDTEALCNMLAARPDIGERMQTKRFGAVRRHGSGNYVVYFRPIADGVEILRVLHGARQQDRLV